MSGEYRVSLDAFSGPLDLLLFLVKKEEVDIHDVPIARVLEQYLAYLKVLQELDLDEAGEFLVMASTLMLIKSRLLLPTEDVDLEEEIDPRYELVQQLLEYKKVKDGSEVLEERRRLFADMAGRPESARPEPLAAEDRELEETSLWDLLEAFGRVMEAMGPQLRKGRQRILVDDRPVSHYLEEMRAVLSDRRSVRFTELLGEARSRQAVIGRFLALLLLLKRELVVCAQAAPDEIRIIWCGGTSKEALEGDDLEEFR